MLSRLGAEHVIVVHSEDGLDEISPAAPTFAVEAKAGEISERTLTPESLGLQRISLDGLGVDSAVESLNLVRDALSGAGGDRAERARTVIALNAGAALYVAGLHASIREGVAEAMRLMRSGEPWARVEALAELTSSM